MRTSAGSWEAVGPTGRSDLLTIGIINGNLCVCGLHGDLPRLLIKIDLPATPVAKALDSTKEQQQQECSEFCQLTESVKLCYCIVLKATAQLWNLGHVCSIPRAVQQLTPKEWVHERTLSILLPPPPAADFARDLPNKPRLQNPGKSPRCSGADSPAPCLGAGPSGRGCLATGTSGGRSKATWTASTVPVPKSHLMERNQTRL